MTSGESGLPAQLVSEIERQSARSAAFDTGPLLVVLKERFGGVLTAVFLYGSCMRQDVAQDAVLDLLVVVSDYRNAYQSRWQRWMNALLPPNVYYLESRAVAGVLRAKYAVISLADLQDGVDRWFHSYIWARLAQPMRLLYAPAAGTAGLVHALRAQALLHFFRRTLPMHAVGPLDPESAWVNGLTLTYAAELRPEPAGRVALLIREQSADLIRLADAAFPELRALVSGNRGQGFRLTVDAGHRRKSATEWLLRRCTGRWLSILRLGKAAFTFQDGIDYAAWKVERHTGEKITVTPRLRRHPLLFGWVVLWRLMRRGILR